MFGGPLVTSRPTVRVRVRDAANSESRKMKLGKTVDMELETCSNGRNRDRAFEPLRTVRPQELLQRRSNIYGPTFVDKLVPAW